MKAFEKKDRDSKIFQFLLKEVKPRVVLLHGVDARKHLALMVDQQIKEDHVHDVDLYGAKTKILAISHLSRGWSKQKTLAVGHLLRELCSM